MFRFGRKWCRQNWLLGCILFGFWLGILLKHMVSTKYCFSTKPVLFAKISFAETCLLDTMCFVLRQSMHQSLHQSSHQSIHQSLHKRLHQSLRQSLYQSFHQTRLGRIASFLVTFCVHLLYTPLKKAIEQGVSFGLLFGRRHEAGDKIYHKS